MTISPIDTQLFVPWTVAAIYTRYVGDRAIGEDFEIMVGQYDRGQRDGGNSYGAYILRDERFTFALDALAFDPQLGDTIKRPDDDNLTRYITKIERSDFLKFFAVDTSAPDINGSFAATVNIKRPTVGKAAWGGRSISTFTTTESEIQIALQPENRSMTQGTSRHATEFNFVGYFPGIYLIEGDIVEDTATSTIYEVISQSDIDRLGVFSMARLQRKI